MSEGLKDFYKRWNIPLDEKTRLIQFMNKTRNVISEILGNDFSEKIELRNCYLNALGFPIEQKSALQEYIDYGKLGFDNTGVYKILAGQHNIVEYIRYLEEVFKLPIESKKKTEIYKAFRDIIKTTGVTINLTKNKRNVLFYPAGARLLDEKLVNDNLLWLQDYPEIYKHFENALQLYQKGKFERSLLDNLRFSLEQLLKAVLSNNTPLEKQVSNLGTFLASKKINTEIRNMYVTLINYFTKYQNANVKHNDGYNPKEVEFVIYLTGTFMRLLLQIK